MVNQRRRVPDGNTVEFVDATPQGLVDVKNAREFMEASPKDFMDALKRTNEQAAREGIKFLAIRVEVPRNIRGLPEAKRFDAAARIAFDSFHLGRIDGPGGGRDGPMKPSVYLIMPDTVEGVKIRDRRGFLPCPQGFLETTPDGFKGAANCRKFLEEAPSEFLEQYKKMQKEHPDHELVLMRTPLVSVRGSDAQVKKAALNAAWKAWQINPPYTDPRIRTRADFARIVFANSYTGYEKTDQKKDKKAAGGGGIAGMSEQSEKDATSGVTTLEGALGAMKVDKKKKKKKGKKTFDQGGIAGTFDPNAAVEGDSSAASEGGIGGMLDLSKKEVNCGVVTELEGAKKVNKKKKKKGKKAAGQGGVAGTLDPNAAVEDDSVAADKKTVV